MKTIIANWKMNLGIRESVALARGVLREMRGQELLPEVVLCPSFTALSEVHKVTARSRVKLGGQTCGPERSGAYTGEVSVAMLEDTRCDYVLVGHSERRQAFGETDELVARKMRLIVMETRLTPVLCVGEPPEQREKGGAQEFVERQLHIALRDLSGMRARPLLIAYEPVWAIGTGTPATVGEVVEMHAHIRRVVAQRLGPAVRIHVLYGGSVTPENAYQFLRESEVDGLLVGGASLRPAQFHEILKAAVDVLEAQGIS